MNETPLWIVIVNIIFGIGIGLTMVAAWRTAKACEEIAGIMRRSEELTRFDRKKEQQAKKPF